MLLLRWLWIGNGKDGEIPPIAVFWSLRVLMFVLGFVLEDWAIHELIESTRHRRVAVLLVASSYVTWTYQTHTFSNSIETLVVAWSLVLIERIVSPVCRIQVCSQGSCIKERYCGCIASRMWTDLLTICCYQQRDSQQRDSLMASTVLGMLAVFGIFNRITFPAFLLIPGIRLIPYFWNRYSSDTPVKFSWQKRTLKFPTIGPYLSLCCCYLRCLRPSSL